MEKTIAVCGGRGFIARHLIRRLKQDGHYVRAFGRTHDPDTLADEYHCVDLRYLKPFDPLFQVDEVYQLACEVGGLGYICDAANDATMLHNSVSINLRVIEACLHHKVSKVFYASSACVYPPAYTPYQLGLTPCREQHAYPVYASVGEHAWEKIFSERLYAAHARCHGLDVRIARYHNTYGPGCTWQDPRAKVVAAICRKVAMLPDSYDDVVPVWGDGTQVRTFVHVDDVIEGTLRLMESDYPEPLNIGSTETLTIDELVHLVASIAGRSVTIQHVDGPVGVHARSSDNTLIRQVLDWEPAISIHAGIRETYEWVKRQVDNAPKPV
jgi:nucleoside-diphosphate-sugar epimerase